MYIATGFQVTLCVVQLHYHLHCHNNLVGIFDCIEEVVCMQWTSLGASYATSIIMEPMVLATKKRAES